MSLSSFSFPASSSFSLPLSLLFLFFSVALAQAGDVPGHLTVGDAVPTGSLRNAADETVALADALNGKPTALIFYRGGWCPYCTKHLSALVDVVDDLQNEGVQMIAISPDRPAKLREKAVLGEVPYTLLSDSSMALSQAFGIAFQVEDELVEKYKTKWGIDLEGDSGETHHLLPHPSVFVVDGEGVIQFAHVDDNYKKRLKPEKVLAAAQAVAAQ